MKKLFTSLLVLFSFIGYSQIEYKCPNRTIFEPGYYIELVYDSTNLPLWRPNAHSAVHMNMEIYDNKDSTQFVRFDRILVDYQVLLKQVKITYTGNYTMRDGDSIATIWFTENDTPTLYCNLGKVITDTLTTGYKTYQRDNFHFRVNSRNGEISIRTNNNFNNQLKVFSVTGVYVFKTYFRREYQMVLPRGIYILHINNNVSKQVVIL